MSNSSIWPIARTLSGATTPGQSESGSDANKEVLRIPQRSSITGTLTIRLFWVISRTLIGEESSTFAEMQSVYSTAPADWTGREWSTPSLPLLLVLLCPVSWAVEYTDCTSAEG